MSSACWVRLKFIEVWFSALFVKMSIFTLIEEAKRSFTCWQWSLALVKRERKLTRWIAKGVLDLPYFSAHLNAFDCSLVDCTVQCHDFFYRHVELGIGEIIELTSDENQCIFHNNDLTGRSSDCVNLRFYGSDWDKCGTGDGDQTKGSSRHWWRKDPLSKRCPELSWFWFSIVWTILKDVGNRLVQRTCQGQREDREDMILNVTVIIVRQRRHGRWSFQCGRMEWNLWAGPSALVDDLHRLCIHEALPVKHIHTLMAIPALLMDGQMDIEKMTCWLSMVMLDGSVWTPKDRELAPTQLPCQVHES